MATIINCKKNALGGHNFYITHDGKKYYLFSQNYHRGVNIYFEKGVSLENVMNVKTAHRDHCVIKTMAKMKPYINYIEKEYNIKILDTTKQKHTFKKEYKAPRINIYDYDLDEIEESYNDYMN